jgi:hypothetical protein
MGFEPTIPVLEREKTFHALDRAATVIDKSEISITEFAWGDLGKQKQISVVTAGLLAENRTEHLANKKQDY